MDQPRDYEVELRTSPEDAAAVLDGVADGLRAGAVRVGEGEAAVTVGTPDALTLEVELEVDAEETSLELELEWPSPEAADALDPADEADDEAPRRDAAEERHGAGATGGEPDADETRLAGVGAAGSPRSMARFEVFRDRGGEWRWRLRHRNGNVIATSGEGYTRRHNAWKGLRSVVRNAPGAEVVDESES